MSAVIGYAVVEWNQASRLPSVLDGSFTDDLEEARKAAAIELVNTQAVGRRETYTVVKLVEVEAS